MGNNGSPKQIFQEFTPSPHIGLALSKGVHKIPNTQYIRTDDGVRNWTHRIGAIGNAVNPTIAHYLFDCIKKF